MEKRSLFSRIFGNDKSVKEMQTSTEFKLLDNNKAIFTSYRGDFKNDPDVRACIDTIARNGAKMHPKHIRVGKDITEYIKGNIYRIIAKKPNEIQNAYKFYYQILTELEQYNNSMIYIQKDKDLKLTGLYPLKFNTVQMYEYKDALWVKFKFGGGKERFVPYNDIIHLTRFTSEDGVFGGNTEPIKKVLSIKHVLDEGIVNAIKTTQSIRGIIKAKKSILKAEDVKKMRDQFVKEFMEDQDGSGIGGLDAETDFTPVKIEPTTATDGQIKSIDNKILSYFGLNENVVQSKYNEDEWDAFYESVLEPIGLQMSLEFSNKIFTPTEQFHGNEIIFECNRLQYASTKTKTEVVRYCGNIMMVDELREMYNLGPLPNGEGQKILIDQNHTSNINSSNDVNEEGGDTDEGN